MEIKNDVLSRSLKYLRSLPPNVQEWEQVIPEFVESLNAIREVKEAQRRLATNIDTTISDIKDAFSMDRT
ncbi:MAG: hypothetical protein OXI59_12850 [Gemmatimonadota bacterium]|nr:hypothetical protein [Gemmatimonadota bacterium]